MEKQELLNFVRGKLMSSDIGPKDTLVLAISGGADSMALLDIMNKLFGELNVEIVPVHINHGLRSDAKKDEQAVLDYCLKNKLELVVRRVNVKKVLGAQGGGIEEKARELRYVALNQVALRQKAKYIITAHNADDRSRQLFLTF